MAAAQSLNVCASRGRSPGSTASAPIDSRRNNQPAFQQTWNRWLARKITIKSSSRPASSSALAGLGAAHAFAGSGASRSSAATCSAATCANLEYSPNPT